MVLYYVLMHFLLCLWRDKIEEKNITYLMVFSLVIPFFSTAFQSFARSRSYYLSGYTINVNINKDGTADFIDKVDL